MRTPLLLLIATLAFTPACGHSGQNRFTIRSGNVARMEGCNVKMHRVVLRDDDRFADLNYACGVPAASLNEKNWWGDKPEPLGFSMRVGSCLLLDETFYCVENIGAEEMSFKATYKWATRHHDHLELLR